MYGFLRKWLGVYGRCWETILWPLDNFWRIFEKLRKVVKKAVISIFESEG